MEKTLVIVKPDAFKKGATGAIIDRFLKEGFKLKAIKGFKFTEEAAKGFYIVHKERPFYKELVDFMCSGPVVAMVLEGENVIQRVRDIIGPTDSNEARQKAPNSIRALYGTDKGQNAVHASDSKESADYEIGFIFSCIEML